MLLLKGSTTRTLEEVLGAKNRVFSSLFRNSPCYSCTQRASYVKVYMKWKKDCDFDSIETIYRSLELRRVIALKNYIARSPDGCIPISDISKRGKEFDVTPMKVATFLRMYPSVFEEFVGPQYNLPWFRLTPKAIKIDIEEKAVYENHKSDLRLRLKKLILMNRDKMLPVKIILGVQWYLGLPDDFLKNPEHNLDESFRFVDLEDGEKALAVDCRETILSTLQINAINRGECNGEGMEPISFPLFPARCSKLKREIARWLRELQKLPYVSPYEDFSLLSPDTDMSEKRVVGVLHELLSLFVEHAAQRRKILCLKKFLHLPQKFHKVFERHPHMFYLSLKANTCTAILREAYRDKTAIPRHPLATVREKYIELMKDSKRIMIAKRSRPPYNPHKDSESHSASDIEQGYEVWTSVHPSSDNCVRTRSEIVRNPVCRSSSSDKSFPIRTEVVRNPAHRSSSSVQSSDKFICTLLEVALRSSSSGTIELTMEELNSEVKHRNMQPRSGEVQLRS